jgi:hypothetical protein
MPCHLDSQPLDLLENDIFFSCTKKEKKRKKPDEVQKSEQENQANH